MVVALSRFRVANGMEGDVARAFRERPRAVEQAPGFLWLEVLVDRADPAVFYLVTRWTDVESFRRWHDSPAHRESHALIPKGLKLDASWTQVLQLDRLDAVTGSPLTDAIADATLLVGAYAESSPAIYLFVLAADGTIRTCNAAAKQRLAPGGTVEGTPLARYMPEADGDHLRAQLREPGRHALPLLFNFAATNCVPFTLECWLDVHPEGAVVLGQLPVQRDRQTQDELMALTQELAVLSRERARLVRDERAAREAAEKVNRERHAFLTVLAHELKQPIGSAMAALGVLRRMNPDPQLERTRGVLERQLRQLTRLVEDLTDTARVAAGEVQLRREPVDVAAYVRGQGPVWESMALEQHKVFAWHAPATPLVVTGDPDRLQQVYSNLVGNAFKYTPDGGTVTVSLSAAGRFAELTVQDEGEGISADRLPYIFDLFQRATNTGSGLGVGLAVVRSLVEAHGGTVTAASVGLGRGSTFIVRLPLAPA